MFLCYWKASCSCVRSASYMNEILAVEVDYCVQHLDHPPSFFFIFTFKTEYLLFPLFSLLPHLSSFISPLHPNNPHGDPHVTPSPLSLPFSFLRRSLFLTPHPSSPFLPLSPWAEHGAADLQASHLPPSSAAAASLAPTRASAAAGRAPAADQRTVEQGRGCDAPGF
jgi:hypothetical protein